jgi:hypothetical protein
LDAGANLDKVLTGRPDWEGLTSKDNAIVIAVPTRPGFWARAVRWSRP